MIDWLIDMIYITVYIYFWIIQFLIMIKNKFDLSQPYVTFADPGIFALIFLFMRLLW
jgi:hypothetical protein